MKSTNIIYIALFFALSFISCEEKMVVIPDYVPPVSDRVVLLEEFTGAACPNCPAAAAEVENLLGLFGENLVVVGIHSNFLANPIKQGDKDLRSVYSQAVESFVGKGRAKPEAAFNRVKFEDEVEIRVRKRSDEWVTFVEKELEKFAKVYIESEVNYDHNTRVVDIDVTAEAQEILEGNYRINVMITESGIMTAQADGGSIIDPYEQKHVLRTMLTDVAGDAFFTSLDPGLTRERSFSFTFPEEEGWWIPENSEVIVFISDGATKEVLQAHSAHVVE